jgi:hypothetical protein
VTVYLTVLVVWLPALSVAVTVKSLVPVEEVSIGRPSATVPLQVAIGLVIAPSRQRYAARTVEPSV